MAASKGAPLDKDSEQSCLFGVRVGIVPTSDAKVKETCATLAKAHPSIVALVDGDGEGVRYADSLDEEGAGAVKVLRWPDGWTIEDVVCWIIEADERSVLARLDHDLAAPPGDRATFLARLKSTNRATHGLKGDGVAYEIIANAMMESEACRDRTRVLLQALTDACGGVQTRYFASEARAQGPLPRLIFAP